MKDRGVKVSRDFVRKVLVENQLRPIQPRSFVPRTTDSRHTMGYSPNLLLDRPRPTGPNQVWVSDITYIPLATGKWLYLAVWVDLWSRRVVGWCLADHMRDELVITALRRALLGRQPADGLILHSDRGGQYASKDFRKLLTGKYLQSMSRAGECYDNATAESFWSRLKGRSARIGCIFKLRRCPYRDRRLHRQLLQCGAQALQLNTIAVLFNSSLNTILKTSKRLSAKTRPPHMALNSKGKLLA